VHPKCVAFALFGRARFGPKFWEPRHEKIPEIGNNIQYPGMGELKAADAVGSSSRIFSGLKCLASFENRLLLWLKLAKSSAASAGKETQSVTHPWHHHAVSTDNHTTHPLTFSSAETPFC
jgi:hypothetical protein